MSERVDLARSLLAAIDRDHAADTLGLGSEGAARLIAELLLNRTLALDEWLDGSAREALAAGLVDGHSEVDRRVVMILAGSVPVTRDSEPEASVIAHPWPPGTRVRIRTQAAPSGVVITVRSAGADHSYLVFTTRGTEAWYAATDLERMDRRPSEATLTHSDVLQRLGLTKLAHRFSDVFYSYRASRTQFQAYQFKPLLKYIDMDAAGDARGLLIADEVGLGKTIEAGIIFMEARARSSVERALIVCPAGLVRKWQAELWHRFDEDVQMLDRRSFARWVERYADSGGVTPLSGVISLESLRGDTLREALEKAMVHFDLVIVDEAHHLRNDQTKSHQVIESLANLTDRLILLTATPVQMHQEDLFNLLALVAPEDFEHLADFEDRLIPNAYLNRAASALSAYPPDVRRAAAELDALAAHPLGRSVTGNPGFEGARLRLRQPGGMGANDVVAVRRQVQHLNTLAHVYTRTRKRDVMDAARRQPHTLSVELDPAERVFYEAVLGWVRESTIRRGEWGALGFALVGRERQAASCLPAAAEYFVELAADDVAELGQEMSDPDQPADDAGPVRLSATEEMRRAAIALINAGVDSKYDRFLEALRQQLIAEPEGKILVFSFFKRTLRYLSLRLRADGIPSVLVTGDIAPPERARVLEDFHRSPGASVLLSSEVGAEGLDLQFSHVLFNYDLPWNPMRVEQRIGRIDRYGQKADRVLIFNFVLDETIESRILARLYERIDIFREAVGDLEPILGDVVNFITQALFDGVPTPAEELQLAHELERRLAEQEEDLRLFESRHAELMGNDQLFDGDVRERIDSGRFVSAIELHTLVHTWLRRNYPDAGLATNGDGSHTLRGDPDLAAHLTASVRRATGTDARGRAFAQRLQSSDLVPITFDTDVAQDRPAIELVHPRHILVQAAVADAPDNLTAMGHDVAAHLRVITDVVDPGTWFFFVYRVEVNAAASAHTLEARVYSSSGGREPRLENRILRLLLDSVDGAEGGFLADAFKVAEARAKEGAIEIRAQRHTEETERNSILLAMRRDAVERAALVKRRRATDILSRVGDERIRRMKEREIENIDAQLRQRLRDLDSRARVVVSVSPVLSGQLTTASPQVQLLSGRAG